LRRKIDIVDQRI